MSLAASPRGHLRSRLCATSACILALLSSSMPSGEARAQSVSDEYRLKAAFFFRFPQFVEWPPHALEGRATIDLCLMGPHQFGDVLDELVRGESLAGRSFVIRGVREVKGSAAQGCQLLYLSEQLTSRRAVLRALADQPILTVSDAPGFLDEGGIVQLQIVDKRVRFSIDTDAAERAGLRLSAQLLRLAMLVRGGQP